MVFLILILWVVFYLVDSANTYNQTFRLVNKINNIHLADKVVSLVFKVIGMIKKIFIELPVAFHCDMISLCCKRTN